MIASITGILTTKTPSLLIIDVHGIGYQVFVPLSTFYHLPEVKETTSLQTYTHVREDAFQLYGFLTLLEKELFLLLLGVSGIGPKLALNILSGMEIMELAAAIQEGNIQRLRAIPGVGPKTAGRLVLELKEKVASLKLAGLPLAEPLASGEDKIVADALSALVNLGYNRSEAKKVLDGAELNGSSVEGLIKQALKKLARIF